MRSLLTLSLAVALAAPAAWGTPNGVTVTQGADSAITEGEVTIDGDPASVFAAAQNYKAWTELMPDVAKVEIHDQKGDEAHVTLVAPNGHRDNLHFHNTPQARLIWFEDTGNGGRADVWAEIVFLPAVQPTSTRVHIRLYAKLHGVATLVVSESDVKAQREQKITAELSQMREYFRRRVANR
jgi:uncharacterized membrane protein